MKHLLIDFENIQPINLDQFVDKNTHIWLFLSAEHETLPIHLVQSLMRMEDRAHLVHLPKMSHHSLDVHLSYYLGQIIATNPQTEVSILSQNQDYDILIKHIIDNQTIEKITRLDGVTQPNHNITPPTSPILPTPQPTIAKKTEIAAKAVSETETHNHELHQPQMPMPKSSETVEPKQHVSLSPYYQAVMIALRQQNAFRPSYLHNLRQNLQKYVLRDFLIDKNELEQEGILNSIIKKLISQKFIMIDERETIHYHVSDEDVLFKIQKHILTVRPKNYAEFQNLVQTRAEALGLNITTNDIQQFAHRLYEQNLIRQKNGEMEYAPFTSNKPVRENEPPAVFTFAPSPKAESALNLSSDMINRALVVTSVDETKRPSKLSGLLNFIRTSTKCNEQELVHLVQYLQDNQYIQIIDNKVIYKKTS